MAESLSDRAARFHQLAINLLPRGIAWARVAGSSLSDNLSALVYEFARVEEAADTYRTEMDPREATALLPEWETVLGLPDDCGSPTTTAGRRGAIVARLTGGGTNNLEALASAVETFDTETALHAITHPTQFEVGTDDGGAGQPVGGDEWAHTVTLQIVTYADDLDVDGLECVLNGIKRAHGHYIFEYYETQATFRGGTLAPFFGLNWTSWANAGDVATLPSGFAGTVPKGFINALDALDFDGASTFVTTDGWQDYVSTSAKYVAFVVEVDAAGALDLIVSGSLSWGVFIEDPGSGPVLTGWSYDGGAGIFTSEIPIALGTTYVVELLHADGAMTLRVFDGTVYQEATVAAPASTVVAGVMGISPLGTFNGRVAGLVTYGARDRVPLESVRNATVAALAALYIP